MVLIVREILGFAVDRRRRGVDHTVDVVSAGGFEDGLRTVDVVLGDFGWLFDTGSDARLGGLVVDYVDVFDEFIDEVFVCVEPSTNS